MQIDVPAHIEKLLFLHDTLIIPSFGGFTAMRVPAAVDYAGGTVVPPSKTLSFNENLSIDDGVLVNEIVKEHGVRAEDARQAIEQFVEKMQIQLNQREIVTLPGVGRLYKNYVQKIQFLPDSTNFHAGSYGLPPLQFSPIARSRDVTEKPAPTPSAPPPPPAATQANAASAQPPATASQPAKTATSPAIPPLPPPPPFVNDPYTPPRSSAAQMGTGIGIGLLLCVLAFGIWWWQHKKASTTGGPSQQAADLSQANETQPPAAPMPGLGGPAKPMPEAEKTEPAAENPNTEKEEQDLGDEVEEASAQKVDIIRRQNEAPASQAKGETRHCILLIATLQDRNNADRLVAKLKGAGYDVYYRRLRGHQVGIQFDYNNPREVEEKKAELIRFTGEKSVFVKQR